MDLDVLASKQANQLYLRLLALSQSDLHTHTHTHAHTRTHTQSPRSSFPESPLLSIIEARPVKGRKRKPINDSSGSMKPRPTFCLVCPSPLFCCFWLHCVQMWKELFSFTLIQRHGTLLFFVSLKHVGILALPSRRGTARVSEASGVKQLSAGLQNQNPAATRHQEKCTG